MKGTRNFGGKLELPVSTWESPDSRERTEMTVMFPSFGSDSEDSKAGMPTAPYMVTDVSRVASLRQNRTAANLEDPMCQ